MKKNNGPAWLLSDIKHIIFLFFLMFCSWPVLSQSLPKERDKFIKECSKIFVNEDIDQSVTKHFSGIINSSGLIESSFSSMVDNANVLLKKGEVQSAYHYVSICMFKVKNKWPTEFFNTWSGLEREYRVLSTEEYEYFMTFSNGLFKYRALNFNDELTWVFKGSMEWVEGKKLQIQCGDGQLIGYGNAAGDSHSDSLVISETGGLYDVKSKKFLGKSGDITWEKVGFSKLETFASLKNYKIDMSKMSVKADSVMMTTPYFQKPIMGIVLNQLGTGFPQFKSYEKRLKISNLMEDLDYDGGFSLSGSRFIGVGNQENFAKLIFKYEDKPFMTFSALEFNVDPSGIIARSVRLKLHHSNGDSLIHKDCMLQFEKANGLLTITANKKGNTPEPFIDYHYKIRSNAPVLLWTLKSPYPKYTYEMATSQDQKIIKFESLDFFDDVLYSKFQGGSAQNPLDQLATFCKTNRAKSLTEGQASTALGTTISYAKSTLLEMASYNFIDYNASTKIITPLQKLFDFVQAKSGEKDYDNISYTCDLSIKKEMESGENATKMAVINLRKKRQDFYAFIDTKKDQMFLTGVDRIDISFKQSSFLVPDSGNVILKPNRDLDFKGWIHAGKLQCFVRDSYFSYQDFKIKIKNSSQAFLVVNPLKTEDGKNRIQLYNSFVNLKGDLLFDQPSSKNGSSNDNAAFPKLLVPSASKVVYNDLDIVRGSYDSSRFYFRLKPFELDSLDNFSEKSLRFSGQLISGGIFPPLDEPLRIMNDYSLGFTTQAPTGGLPFYGDNSKYENKIVLSHNGLQGSGTINFKTATAVSKKLTFLPDSTIGVAQFINLKSTNGVKVPDVSSEAALVTFLPKKQILKASSYLGAYLQMFDSVAKLDGSVILSTSGMKGRGNIMFTDATLFSKEFNFTHQDIHADTSTFKLKNKYVIEGEAPIAMETEGVKADISMVERKGVFNSFGYKRIKFPPNQYYCTMDRFFWYMDRGDLDFEKSKGQQTAFEAQAGLEESNFFSMNDDQDSLSFRSLSAKYDLRLQTIFCNKVSYIRVGDAKIFPDSMKVTVRKYAKMDPLVNAKIVAPFITKYHTFTNANVSITSRSKYEGTASYPYLDRDSNLTVLPLTSIKLLNSKTQAEGEISQSKQFKLSPEFDYYGKIKIVSNSPGIFCSGSTKINHNCSAFDKSWLAFEDTIMAKNIQIPISANPLNEKGTRLAVGFLWKDSEYMDSVKVYPAFLSKIQGKEDPIVFQSSGYVQYNPKSQAFQIGSKNRLSGFSEIGNLLTFYSESCALTGLGSISFGVPLGEVSADCYGDINYEPSTKKIKMDVTALIKFPMQKDVFEYLASEFKDLEAQKSADLKSKKLNFKTYAKFYLSEKNENELFKDYEEDKLRRLPDELDKSIVLSGLRFEFAQFKTKANESGYARGWVTRAPDEVIVDEEGDEVKSKNKISIIGMEGRPVLKELDMNMVLTQTSSDASYQSMTFKYTTATKKEYLFDYSMNKKDGKLQIFSNDNVLKDKITEMKPDKKKSKNFEYDWTDETNVKLILLKFNEYLRSK